MIFLNIVVTFNPCLMQEEKQKHKMTPPFLLVEKCTMSTNHKIVWQHTSFVPGEEGEVVGVMAVRETAARETAIAITDRVGICDV